MSCHKYEFDVIVCGAGHAGIEAGLAASRLGAWTLVVTGNMDTVGQMSCNPAIGGVAKGHLVREIDALGGEMAVTADVTGIQYRLLNSSKGLAVQSPRVQCDKKAYQFRMKHVLERQENLTLFQALVTELIFDGNQVVGCRTNLGAEFRAKTVVITTGTFLRALTHIGENRNEGGRMGDHSSKTLSGSLLDAGIELERLKTGTPPRLLGRSLDFKVMEEQRGDVEPTLFAFHDTRGSEELFHVEHSDEVKLGWTPGTAQVSCWLTYTTRATDRIVRANLDRSAMYSGAIEGVGPRYCPSIEDKIVRFANKERHLLFLEPEGRNTNEYYVNGLSTSLPYDVQLDLVHSVPGLESAVILRPAYAVEYDFAPPTQLFPSLESKIVGNLFLAGQINGTSGYEEAAGQGLVAGVNAAQKVRGREPLVLQRHEGYIGVMIDDLVTKGTREPYRMFTSRAEHRLLFNHTSAESRMLPHTEHLRLVPADRLTRMRSKEKKICLWQDRFETERSGGQTWGELLRKGGEESALPEVFRQEDNGIRAEVLYRCRYRGYLVREQKQIARLTEIEGVRLPADLDYREIRGLRAECVQKLADLRPVTLGQAGRVSGVSPADIGILMVFLKNKFSS
jgi:tRNA uridine 5-carboxymethylaminomethyl modification enzyme